MTDLVYVIYIVYRQKDTREWPFLLQKNPKAESAGNELTHYHQKYVSCAKEHLWIGIVPNFSSSSETNLEANSHADGYFTALTSWDT